MTRATLKRNGAITNHPPGPSPPHAETAERVLAVYEVDPERGLDMAEVAAEGRKIRAEPAAGGPAAPDVAAIPRAVPRADDRDPDRRGRHLRPAWATWSTRWPSWPSCCSTASSASSRRSGPSGRWRPCSGSRPRWPRSSARAGSSRCRPATSCPATGSCSRPGTASRPTPGSSGRSTSASRRPR